MAISQKGETEVEKAMVRFGNAVDTLLVKVGISYTSMENAALNIEHELPHWDFDQVVVDSRDEWNRYLNRIEVSGGEEKQLRRFYTDLWHALQGRRTISDFEGYYPDYTGTSFQIKRVPLDVKGMPKHRHFNSDAFWGAQWTLNTLWHLVYPEISEEFVNSLLLYYRDGGMIPRGPSGGNYTFVMTGSTATPFIVSAWAKGIRGFDEELAFEGCVKNHMLGGIMTKAGYEHETELGGGLGYYIENGWVPHPIPEGDFGYHQDGASLTMEYAYQDWTLAQFAKLLGKEDKYDYFMQRSGNYRNIFDSAVGWARPKDVDGNWKDPYDPYLYENGFNESNGAQSTWFVPHDVIGLAKLMGGVRQAVEKLTNSFEQAEKLGFTSGTSHAAETHPEYRRIPINYGNQPSIQTAFIFSELGRPDLAQKWSRKVVDKVYSSLDPQSGFNGDEDQGLMGSLSVLMKLGVFEVDGGASTSPAYWIGSPLFETAKIHLNSDYYEGDVIEIHKKNPCKNNKIVGQAIWNEVELDKMKIDHSELTQGGVLQLSMAKCN